MTEVQGNLAAHIPEMVAVMAEEDRGLITFMVAVEQADTQALEEQALLLTQPKPNQGQVVVRVVAVEVV
jgi:hypothetical protein